MALSDLLIGEPVACQLGLFSKGRVDKTTKRMTVGANIIEVNLDKERLKVQLDDVSKNIMTRFGVRFNEIKVIGFEDARSRDKFFDGERLTIEKWLQELEEDSKDLDDLEVIQKLEKRVNALEKKLESLSNLVRDHFEIPSSPISSEKL